MHELRHNPPLPSSPPRPSFGFPVPQPLIPRPLLPHPSFLRLTSFPHFLSYRVCGDFCSLSEFASDLLFESGSESAFESESEYVSVPRPGVGDWGGRELLRRVLAGFDRRSGGGVVRPLRTVPGSIYACVASLSYRYYTATRDLCEQGSAVGYRLHVIFLGRS